jgi:hypothetical protein
MRRAHLAPLALTILQPLAVSAQQPLSVMRVQRDRWIHSSQRDATVAFDLQLASVTINAISATPTGRVFEVAQSNQVTGTVAFDSVGRLTSITAGFLAPARTAARPPADVARSELARRFEQMSQMDGHLWLPAARFWTLTYTFRPPSLSVGANWSDTLDLRSSDGDLAQEMQAVRRSVIVGDTMVNGERLWLVRDTSTVRLLERFPPIDRDAIRTRDVTGVEVGLTAWDAATRLPRWRDDSLRAEGSVRDLLPDGRTIVTDARYERSRRIDVVPVTQREAFIVAFRAADTTRRAARSDTLSSVLLATGDTAAALRVLAHAFPYAARLGAADAGLIVTALSDPARAQSWNANSHFLEADTRRRLLAPVPALTADTATWRCLPEACRTLAAAWHGARERDLRSLALVANFALEPRRWADTVIAEFPRDTARLQEAVWLIRGVGGTWPASSHAPLPEPGATWQDWVEWMDGSNPNFPRVALPGRDTTTPAVRFRFGDGHRQAIRMRELLTGRNVERELQLSLATATDDTARSVFRSLLTSLGATQESADVIAERISSPDPVVRDAARREVNHLLNRASVADSATTRSVQAAVLEAVIDGTGPLSEVRENGRPLLPRYTARTGDSVFIRAYRLHPDLRARWSSFGTMLADSAAAVPTDVAPVSVFEPGLVHRDGPFVRVSIGFWQWVPGARAAPSPGAWATDHVLDLMWNGARWVLVNGSQLIT